MVQCSIFNNLSVDVFELLVSSNEVCAIVGVDRRGKSTSGTECCKASYECTGREI